MAQRQVPSSFKAPSLVSALHGNTGSSKFRGKTVYERASLLLVSCVTAESWVVLIEQHDGQMLLPGIVVDTDSPITYRSQLIQRIQDNYHDFPLTLLSRAHSSLTWYNI